MKVPTNHGRTPKMLAIAILIVLLLCHTPAMAARTPSYVLMSNYNQWVYDYSNGMPSTSVNDVLQTSDGYIWMATYAGLVRFSGDAFHIYAPETEEAFHTFNIIALFEDSGGRLWIGTNDDGALIYENRKFRKLETNIGNLSVSSFAEKPDGTILMGTKSGIFEIGADSMAHHTDTITVVEQLLVDSRGDLWALDAYGRLSAPEAYRQALQVKYNYSAIYEDSRGNVFLGTEPGQVLVMAEDGGKISETLLPTEALSHVNDFCEDLNGNIWVVADTGMGIFDESLAFTFADGTRLANSLDSIIADHEGGLWVASSRNGLLQLMPTVIRDINFAANLGERVTNTAIIYRGNIYAGTDGGLTVVDARTFEVLDSELSQMLESIRIRCLTEDSRGNLWIATYEKYGAICYGADGTITCFTQDMGLASDKVRQIMELSDGRIAVGTGAGVTLIENGAIAKTYGPDDGLTNAVILSIVEDSRGRLWLGSDGGGIFIIEDGQVHPVDMGATDSKVILRMHYDAEKDALWIATGSSFYFYADGMLTELPHIAAEVKSVFDIVDTNNGHIALLATEGIYYGSREDLLGNTEDLVLIRITGSLPYRITANSWNRIDADGNLFLCASAELGLFNIGYMANNASPVRLIIDDIVVDNESLFPSAQIDLPSVARRMTVSVSSPHYGFAEKITFEYYLEGFDTQPQHLLAGQVNDITYTNLAGGEYVFRVCAINGAGLRGQEHTFIVSKAYQPWESVEFWIAAVILLAGLVYGLTRLAVKYHTHKILMKQREYQHITNQAIMTISNAIDAKDEYTEGHSERVAAYAVEVGRRMGLHEEALERLRYIALLHDIGKIGIHDDILNKPDRLSDEEFYIMRSHTLIGGDILRNFDAVPNLDEGAMTHHEKYDGTGYPRGLKGEEISLTSRIIGVCDTYDAMSSTRAYRKGLDSGHIIEELKKHSGTQFDPVVANVMIEMIQDGFTAERRASQTADSKKPLSLWRKTHRALLMGKADMQEEELAE